MRLGKIIPLEQTAVNLTVCDCSSNYTYCVAGTLAYVDVTPDDGPPFRGLILGYVETNRQGDVVRTAGFRIPDNEEPKSHFDKMVGRLNRGEFGVRKYKDGRTVATCFSREGLN